MMHSNSAASHRFIFRLYIAGDSPSSGRAVANLRAFCEKRLGAPHMVEIVDVMKDTRRALADGIIVTPTLVRLAPVPRQKIVGDLRDEMQLRDAFEPAVSTP